MFETQLALQIPSAFTPNNDQANDTWKITPMKQVERLSAFVRVYDKRGNTVFESSGLENEWDGIFNGSPLPADVYFYTIEMDLSYRKISYKGVVAILR
jgi:gliding motility-associated-like protein